MYKLFNLIIFYFKYSFLKNKNIKMGIGDWGLGIGDWGLGIGPNPQSPYPKLIIKNDMKNKIFNKNI